MILIGLLIAAGLFGVLRISKYLLRRFSAQSNTGRILNYFFPIVEFVAWVVYVFWLLYRLFSEASFYPELLLALSILGILLLGWYLIRDFFAGLVFKAENLFSKNDSIRLPDTNGRIHRLGYLAVEIENEAGELERIRYSHLFAHKMIKPNPSSRIEKFTFKLKHPATNTPEEIVQQIRLHIMNAPHSSLTQSPVISMDSQEEQQYTFQATVFVLNRSHGTAVKQFVEKKLAL
jgi:hypothetical protein